MVAVVLKCCKCEAATTLAACVCTVYWLESEDWSHESHCLRSLSDLPESLPLALQSCLRAVLLELVHVVFVATHVAKSTLVNHGHHGSPPKGQTSIFVKNFKGAHGSKL